MSKYTDKQQLLSQYIQCDSAIYRETFITSCNETVRLAHSKYFVHLFTHGVLYIKGMMVNLNHK